MHDYVTAWRSFKPTAAPYLLEGDEAVLLGWQSASFAYRDRAAYAAAVAAGGYSKTALHLGLLPQPFHGRIADAAVYLVALNPGFRPDDYIADYERQDFREALIAQYSGESSVLFMDPRFTWHPGYDWWLNKTSILSTIATVGYQTGMDLPSAQAFVAANIAILQLLPYHSFGFGRKSSMERLRSLTLARSFLFEYVLPKAQRGECGVVVMWGNGDWRVQPDPEHGIVVHGGISGKHVGPATLGGQLMAQRLVARWQEVKSRTAAPPAEKSRKAKARRGA